MQGTIDARGQLWAEEEVSQAALVVVRRLVWVALTQSSQGQEAQCAIHLADQGKLAAGRHVSQVFEPHLLGFGPGVD
jgi:hypothetical protein